MSRVLSHGIGILIYLIVGSSIFAYNLSLINELANDMIYDEINKTKNVELTVLTNLPRGGCIHLLKINYNSLVNNTYFTYFYMPEINIERIYLCRF